MIPRLQPSGQTVVGLKLYFRSDLLKAQYKDFSANFFICISYFPFIFHLGKQAPPGHIAISALIFHEYYYTALF